MASSHIKSASIDGNHRNKPTAQHDCNAKLFASDTTISFGEKWRAKQIQVIFMQNILQVYGIDQQELLALSGMVARAGSASPDLPQGVHQQHLQPDGRYLRRLLCSSLCHQLQAEGRDGNAVLQIAQVEPYCEACRSLPSAGC